VLLVDFGIEVEVEEDVDEATALEPGVLETVLLLGAGGVLLPPPPPQAVRVIEKIMAIDLANNAG